MVCPPLRSARAPTALESCCSACAQVCVHAHNAHRHSQTHAHTHTLAEAAPRGRGGVAAKQEPGCPRRAQLLERREHGTAGSTKRQLRRGHTAGTAGDRQRVRNGRFPWGCCGCLSSKPTALLPAAVLRPRLGHQDPPGQSRCGRRAAAAAGVPLPSSPGSPTREALCPNCDPRKQGYFTDSD